MTDQEMDIIEAEVKQANLRAYAVTAKLMFAVKEDAIRGLAEGIAKMNADNTIRLNALCDQAEAALADLK